MIKINCESTYEADQVIGAFDIAIANSVLYPETSIPPYEEISVSVNDVPYDKWSTFVNGLKFIESLQ